MHVHVEKADAAAKWCMDPIAEEYSYGFSAKERKEIGELIIEHQKLIKDKWYEHFR